MTSTEELTIPPADQLTGEIVTRLRTAFHVGKTEFMQLADLPGKSAARIYNIERNDSWKDGDREKVHAALVRLAADPPKGRLGRQRGESGAERAERLDKTLRDKGLHTDDVPKDDGVGPTLHDATDVDEVLVPSTENGPFTADITTIVRVVDRDDDEEAPDGTYLRDLTNSEVATWQRCRRRWWLAVYRQLTLRQQNFMSPRAIGNRVHRALAAWYVPSGQERTDPRQALELAIAEDWSALATQARERPAYGDDDQVLADLSARFQDAVALERAIVEGYIEWVLEQGGDADYRITAAETEVNAVIEGDVAGELVRFRARALLDVRMTRVSDGVRLFADHKSVGSLTEVRKMLHMDPQMLHYHLLEFLSAADGDPRCDGALYNMLKRSKRTARAKPPFYDRVEVHHNAYEIDAYRRRLLGAARDIMRVERELDAGADPLSVAYPNPTKACGWDCDFFAVCSMFDDGSRVDDALASLYVQRDPMARYDATSRNEEVL